MNEYDDLDINRFRAPPPIPRDTISTGGSNSLIVGWFALSAIILFLTRGLWER